MKVRRFVVNSVICMLLVLNVLVGFLVVESVKPKCVIDGCNRTRCEESFYCKGHTHTPAIKMKVYYGKR